MVTSILAAVLGSLQIGYHTGNVNTPARVTEEQSFRPLKPASASAVQMWFMCVDLCFYHL